MRELVGVERGGGACLPWQPELLCVCVPGAPYVQLP